MADLSHIRACVIRYPPNADAAAVIKAALEENPNNAVNFSQAPLAQGIAPGTDLTVLPEKFRLGLYVRKIWRPGHTLRVFFNGGNEFVRSKVRQYANVWSQYANIKFEFVSSLPAEIRIGFEPIGSWSYVGTDNLWIPSNQNTMNFGWFDDGTSDEEFSRTTIHEFGHALGCIHEHQQPNTNIAWNKPVVYEYHERVDGWTKEMVDSNLFNQETVLDVSASAYDPDSIMHYPIPIEFTTNGFSVGWNTRISARDTIFIQAMYPRDAVTRVGVFNTLSLRSWDSPAQSNQISIKFPIQASSPPNILLGLNFLDVGNAANLRVSAIVEEVTVTHMRLNLLSWADTIQHASGCAWLRVPDADHDLQFGHFSTSEDHSWDNPQPSTTRRINFTRPYDSPPKVVVWLSSLDVGKDTNTRVTVYATDITRNGFIIHIDSWADTLLHGATATWLAHSANRTDVCSGSYSTLDIRPADQPRMENSSWVSFDAGFAAANNSATAPDVFIALNTLDVDRRWNTRLRLSSNNVSKSGMTWHIDSWENTVLFSAGASYVAFAKDL